jgi:phenylalanyl-tRNA synthetase alpha chain
MLDVFRDMGFHIVEGPDIEDEWHNFEALRLHADHPARDSQDSFYLGEDRLLKTHTSPVQIRYMEENPTPIQMIAPGTCFRRDPFTSRHSPVFTQLEGLMIDEGITFADLKGVLSEFVRGFFGRERKMRFRPDFFPFVEPGCEVAMDCPFCVGSGCRVCSKTGWIEILGAGMVHPGVLENCGIDSKKYTGFAFGTGVERPAMIRYGIDDIRHFWENDFRFLEQF